MPNLDDTVAGHFLAGDAQRLADRSALADEVGSATSKILRRLHARFSPK